MSRFGLYSSRVLFEGELREATITINHDKIEFVEWGHARPEGIVIEDHRDSVIMPGLIDSHVHINEPGRTDWEGFDTATRSAAAGGITTLVDMPLNSMPVTTTLKALDQKLEAASKQLHVNCGFYGGIVPGSESHIAELAGAGVFGFKVFLAPSGIDDFPNVTEADLRKAIPLLKPYPLPLLVHAELESPHRDQALLEENPFSHHSFLRSRPKLWEDSAILLMIALCREFRHPTHIVHLSSSSSVSAIKAAVLQGLPVSTETCPHYLFFHSDEIPDKATQFKCAPPIRERSNNELLWDAVRRGVISFIVTDHSPAPPQLKELTSGNFKKAWGGISGLQLSLPVVWTRAKERGFTIPEIADRMSGNVAKFLGLSESKGKIAKGYDADLIVWNPEKQFRVTPESIHFRHKITPYEGKLLHGVVERTYVGGNLVYDSGEFKKLNSGQILKRKI